LTYAPLHVHSGFSFLDGADTVERLVERAASLGCPALALTDHDCLTGAVELRRRADEAGIKPIQGVELTVPSILDDPSAGGRGGLAPDLPLFWAGAGQGRPGPPPGADSDPPEDLDIYYGFDEPPFPGRPTRYAHHIVLLADGVEGYGNICRILSDAHLGNPRLRPIARLETLRANSRGLFALSGCRRGEIPSLVLHGLCREAEEAARRYAGIFGRDRFFLELCGRELPGSRRLNSELAELAGRLGIGVVAATNAHHADRSGFELHDLLTCVRTLTTLDDVHPERPLNAEGHIRSPGEMEELFTRFPEALETTTRIAEACRPAPELGIARYPSFPLPRGLSAEEFLRRLVYEGAGRRYRIVTRKVRERLEHELDVINRLGYADYFLIVWDVARYARERGIRYAGRGSAADSAVAYCLGVTGVDPVERGLMFERFLSLERAQRPDVDVDFDARRRDEIVRYVCDKYGDDRTAGVCTYSTYRARSVVRDFGKAMGYPPEEVDRLARCVPHVGAEDLRRATAEYPELRDSGLPLERYEGFFELCERAAGLPRHMGTHLGGIVVGPGPLRDIAPLQRSAKGGVICQFDKDYVEDVGLLKLDLLSLRALSAVEDAVAAARGTGRPVDYEEIPLDDRATFEMINEGETIGVFQLESPAQRALQSRLGASRLEDIVSSVALIRPGPVKGNMVEPFIRRRRGYERPSYPHPALRPILEKTYGVVLFQEQVIEIATVLAGFTPGEADRLRRVMTHGRSRGEMEEIGRLFVERATQRGVSRKAAEEAFSQMAGYASYGFCEAHAAAFATTAYKTAYLARHRPAEFYAALLSAQPMGYYPPSTLCVEAWRRGVRLLPVDVNESGRDFEAVDGGRAIRASLKLVRGIGERSLERILDARRSGPFSSPEDFVRRTGVDRAPAENLALCGAFDSLCPNRREALWRARAVAGGGAGGVRGEPLLARVDDGALRYGTGAYRVDDFSEEEKMLFEYDILGLGVKRHLMEHLRRELKDAGYVRSDELRRLRPGRAVRAAGLPVRPHRPPTRSGRTVAFLSLEDEAGLIDVTIFEDVYERCGAVIFSDPCPPLSVEGTVERRGNGTSLTARSVEALTLSCPNG